MILKKTGRSEKQLKDLLVTVTACTEQPKKKDGDFERHDVTYRQDYIDDEGDKAKEISTVQSNKPVPLGKVLLTLSFGMRNAKAGNLYWFEGIDSFTTVGDDAKPTAASSAPKTKS